MPTPFRTTRRVEFADTDMAGIVHFANFFRYMEAAEVEFLRARELSVAMVWGGEKIGFPRVSASCDYMRPARFEDVLDIQVTLRKLGLKSATFGFEFFKDGTLLARGQTSGVCCRVLANNEIESIEIPATVRERLQAALSGPEGA